MTKPKTAPAAHADPRPRPIPGQGHAIASLRTPFTRLDDLDKLVHPAISRKQRLSQHQLRRHAPETPCVDGARVVCRPKDKLWRSVVPESPVQGGLVDRTIHNIASTFVL